MVDRNTQKVREFASRRQLQELERAAGQGRVAVLDGIGRPLRAGDLITVQSMPPATIFRVTKADPILADPRFAGHVHFRIECVVEVALPSGDPQFQLFLIDPIESQIEVTRAAGEISDDAAASATANASAAPAALSPIVLTDGAH